MSKKKTVLGFFNPQSEEAQAFRTRSEFLAGIPGTEEYKQRIDNKFAEVQEKQTQNAQKRLYGEAVSNVTPLFKVFMPLIIGAIILLLIAGPGILAIKNVVFNTSIWIWIGALFLIILLMKLGVFSKK